MSDSKPPRRSGAPGPPSIPQPRAARPAATGPGAAPPAPRPEPAAAPAAPSAGLEAEGPRKLIRPSLESVPAARAGAARRREAPPEATGAEEAWLAKASGAASVLTLRLVTGETLEGRLEWSDRDCLKLRRQGAGSVVVMKAAIVSMTSTPAPRRG